MSGFLLATNRATQRILKIDPVQMWIASVNYCKSDGAPAGCESA